MTTQLAITGERVTGLTFTADQVELITRTVAKDATPDELALFLYQCKRTGLDPLNRQIYCVKRKGKMTIQTSIDGFRLVAERSGQYAGQDGPFWCGEDGKWVDVWLSSKPPVAAKVGALRKDFTQPMWAVAKFSEYQVTAEGQDFMWRKMPALMIAKTAEALALRRAFPQELSGLYTAEEMDQADQPAMPRPSQGYQPVVPTVPALSVPTQSYYHAEKPDVPARSEAQPSKPAAGPVITEKQAKRLWAIIKGSQRDPKVVQAWIFANYGVSTSAAITRDTYTSICAAVEAPGPLPSATVGDDDDVTVYDDGPERD